MSTSSLERHDLEQDIDELRSSIESLQSSRSRLHDVLPASSGAPAGNLWSDLREIVTDFFQVAGEALSEDEEEDDDDSAVSKVEKGVKKAVNIDWSDALGAAFTKLRDRVASDIGIGGASAPPVNELNGVIGELDSEIARLNNDLQQKLDRVAELDRSLDDTDTITPRHRDVTDTTIVTPTDHDIDVTPIPVDVLPDVDPVVVVPDDDSDDDIVVPTPHVDVVDVVIPTPDVVVPDVVVPDVHDDDDKTDDDTPAYDPGNATEIGELDGAIYDVNEILANGRTVADLRKYDVPAGVVLDAGVTASALLEGGYTLADLHEAGVQPADLHGLASASDLRGAGYSASDLHGIFSVSECAEAFSPHEMRDAGFSVSDFHGILSASDLRDTFGLDDLRTVYSIAELHAAGFSAGDLNAGGVSWAELAGAGFTLGDLEGAGASEATLREIFPHEFQQEDETPE